MGDQAISLFNFGKLNYVTTTGTQTLSNKSLVDSSTTIEDETTPTKKIKFECSGISAGTTRTVTAIDRNMTLIDRTLTLNVVDTWTVPGGSLSVTSYFSRIGNEAAGYAVFWGINVIASSTTSSATITSPSGYIPSGYRPLQTIQISVRMRHAGSFGVGLLQVSASGTFTITTISGGAVTGPYTIGGWLVNWDTAIPV